MEAHGATHIIGFLKIVVLFSEYHIRGTPRWKCAITSIDSFCLWIHSLERGVRVVAAHNFAVYFFLFYLTQFYISNCSTTFSTQKSTQTLFALQFFTSLIGGLVCPPPLLSLYQQHRNCSLMQNMLSWCLHVSSKPSQRFNNTKYCTSSLPPCLPPFLIGSHLCTLVTQSAPSPPEPAGQEAQALRVPTAGV